MHKQMTTAIFQNKTKQNIFSTMDETWKHYRKMIKKSQPQTAPFYLRVVHKERFREEAATELVKN